VRKMLLLLATGIGLALGRTGAEAIPFGGEPAAPISPFEEQLLTANSVAPAIAGRLALTVDDGRDAAAVEPIKVDWTLQIDKETDVRRFVLLAIAVVIAGFGAAGAAAMRMLEVREFYPGELADQPPSGMLRANLANLDGLIFGHPARGL
jgi:hypothetical protein